MNLVSIYDQEKLRQHGLLVKPSTLRIWRCKGRYAEEGLFVRFAHKLMIDLDVLQKILQREQEKQKRVGEKMAEAKSFKRGV